jgi:peptidoglycan-associated lipoprotein
MRLSTTLGMLAGAAALFALGCATSSQEVTKAGDFREGGVGRPIATKPAPGLDTVYFDYDRAEIRNDARGKLQGNASVIEDKKWERVVLEGHCDERGSEEYNLALGERRAVAVKQYLLNLGVPASNVTTVSYGESRPAKPGHDETSWQYNRRVEFGLPR